MTDEAVDGVISGSKDWRDLRKRREKLVNHLMGQVLRANPRMSPALVRASIVEKLDAE